MVPGPLTATDLFLATAGGGTVTKHKDAFHIQTPDNPGYFHGNYLLLPEPPSADTLPAWIRRSRSLAPDRHHVCLRWDGPACDTTTQQVATTLGMTDDSGISMTATAIAAPPRADLMVRPLDPVTERPAIVSLNVACDSSEQRGDPDYVAFKEGIRRAWWRWTAAGAASWWGVFDGEQLIAQCGLVRCPGGLARLQSVETHPDRRREGACATLISTVGRDALHRLGCGRVLLAADAEGPARGLYSRLGFVTDGWQRSLLLGGGGIVIRPEQPGDRADIRSLTVASGADPALLSQPNTRALVAERSGTLHGHILLLPPAKILSLVVRPSQQGQGIEEALIAACKFLS
jgi:GNAT superfamily N-acetyltransferase